MPPWENDGDAGLQRLQNLEFNQQGWIGNSASDSGCDADPSSFPASRLPKPFINRSRLNGNPVAFA